MSARMLRLVRRLLVILSILALSIAMSACGASSRPRSAAASATIAAYTAPTRAQATAFARAINLTSADVPGFKQSKPEHEHTTAAEKRLENAMLRCVHPESTQAIVELSSQEFKRESNAGAESVKSEVAVTSSSTMATKELAVIRSSHARYCMARMLDALFKGKNFSGGHIGPVSITAGTAPASSLGGSFAWQISVTLTFHQIRLPMYIEIIGFVDGPAEVSLFTSSFPRPFDTAAEARLFALLQRRAQANPL